MRLYLVAIILAGVFSSPAFADPPHCLGSCPIGAPASNKMVERTLYTISNNPKTKFADWVAYKVELTNLNKADRKRKWEKDPDLKSKNTIVPKEYDDSNRIIGIDRGHQAPLGSFKSHDDWQTTNYLSNITPQYTTLNQGPWKRLEDAVRRLVRAKNVTAYVVTGPLCEWTMPRLPATDKDHRTPSSYWKMVAVEEGAKVKVAAFYFYQTAPYRADYCDGLRTVDFIEGRTKLNLLKGIANEAQIEAGDPGLASALKCERPYW